MPDVGTVAGFDQANVPATEPVPPVSVELDSAAPYEMAEAVGHAVIVGVALFTVTFTVPVAEL